MAHVNRIARGVLAAGLVALAQSAQAERCAADAEFVHSYPSNSSKSEFKFKFRISSDDCKEYGCTGFIHYRIHFDYDSGTSSGKTTLVGYRIPAGQKSREVTDETYPASAGSKIKVRDVEIGNVSCSTP